MRDLMMIPLESNGDEYYTLPIHVNDIIDNLNISKDTLIWCPFDQDWSQFPILLRERGYKVINTSSDFFETDMPIGCSAIISNPPFGRKKDVLKRIRQFEVGYALILPFLFLNDGFPFDYGNQLMFWRKRVHFSTMDGIKNNPRTTCFVLSNGLLKNDLTIINH